MPHLIVEHSNAMSQPAAESLCARLAESLGGHRNSERGNEFPVSGTYVRTLLVEATHRSAGTGDFGFIHAVLKIGAGRDEATKTRTGRALLALLVGFFDSTNKPDITLEIQEFSPQFTWRG
jgi:5-carboxymethyl-2-hydroxymuconate isomerase